MEIDVVNQLISLKTKGYLFLTNKVDILSLGSWHICEGNVVLSIYIWNIHGVDHNLTLVLYVSL
jgi:hypothetical protein